MNNTKSRASSLRLGFCFGTDELRKVVRLAMVAVLGLGYGAKKTRANSRSYAKVDTMSETTLDAVSILADTGPEKSETFFEKLVGINEAATISRASKGQISRDARGERLAYTLDEKGQKRYKVADLFQKYGFRDQSESSIVSRLKPKESNADTSGSEIELAILKTQLQGKDEVIRHKEEAMRRMEEEIRDLRQKQDKHLEALQRFTLLLSAPKDMSQASLIQTERKTFWQRLFS